MLKPIHVSFSLPLPALRNTVTKKALWIPVECGILLSATMSNLNPMQLAWKLRQNTQLSTYLRASNIPPTLKTRMHTIMSWSIRKEAFLLWWHSWELCEYLSWQHAAFLIPSVVLTLQTSWRASLLCYKSLCLPVSPNETNLKKQSQKEAWRGYRT